MPVHAERYAVLPDGRPVQRWSLANAAGTSVDFLELGGIVTSLRVRDRAGAPADVTAGYDSLDGYLADAHYLGALIGRYGNRIAGGRFTLDGGRYALATNDGPNHLHGGPTGFHRALWRVEPFEAPGMVGATLTHTSPAGEGGYPGRLDARVAYTLHDDDSFRIDYDATTDAATPVNLTQHTYFNLAGHASGDVLGHLLTIDAAHYLPVDRTLIPTGERRAVAGTPFDLRRPRPIGEGIREGRGGELAGGYDHTFVLDGGVTDAPRRVARLADPASGRWLEILTTEPGLQVYSGGVLGRAAAGKGGARYPTFGGIALETQHFPNSPNEPSFPSTILRPGETYRSTTIWRFGAA